MLREKASKILPIEMLGCSSRCQRVRGRGSKLNPHKLNHQCIYVGSWGFVMQKIKTTHFNLSYSYLVSSSSKKKQYQIAPPRYPRLGPSCSHGEKPVFTEDAGGGYLCFSPYLLYRPFSPFLFLPTEINQKISLFVSYFPPSSLPASHRMRLMFFFS